VYAPHKALNPVQLTIPVQALITVLLTQMFESGFNVQSGLQQICPSHCSNKSMTPFPQLQEILFKEYVVPTGIPDESIVLDNTLETNVNSFMDVIIKLIHQENNQK